MKSSHLGWTLAVASGAVIAFSLAQLLEPSVSSEPTRKSNRSEEVGSIDRYPAGPIASVSRGNESTREDAIAERVARQHGMSIERLTSPATAPSLPRVEGADAADEWVPLNPPVATNDSVRGSTTVSQKESVVPGGRAQQVTPAAPPRWVHVRVDPSVPGNSLVVDDQLATVEGVVASADAQESEIQISIEEDSSGNTTPGRRSQTARTNRWGLTYEEELFRTKWGWAAFAEVQRLAKTKARQQPAEH